MTSSRTTPVVALSSRDPSAPGPASALRAPCRPAARASILAALLLLAGPAAAQGPPEQPSDAFADAALSFTAAAAGAYGDEGPRLLAALDAMDRARLAWDAHLRRLETQAAAAPSGSSDASRLHLELARTRLQYGRTAEARSALQAAVRHDPDNATAHLLLGALHERTGGRIEAARAYGRARQLHARDPVAAYLLWRHTPVSAEVGAELLVTLRAWYEQPPAPAGPAPGRGAFPDTSPVRASPAPTPLLPPALYADAFRLLAGGQLERGVRLLRERAAGDPLVTGPAARDRGMRAGIDALRAGRLPEALAAFRDAATRLDTSPEPHRLLGLASWADHQSAAATEHLRRAVAIDPLDERTRLSLARILVGDGRLEDAADLLVETVAMLPDSAAASWWLGTVHTSRNRTTDALRVFERAAELPVLAGRDSLLATIARLRETHADFAGAASMHASRVAADPNSAQPRLDLARAYAQLGREDDAFVEYVAAIVLDPTLPAAHLGIGHYYLTAGRHAQAAAAFERAVALDPRATEARYALGLALRDAGRAEESAAQLRAYDELQTQAMHDRRRTMTLDVLVEEAALRTAEGDHGGAAAVWERVLQLQPEAPSHHASLAASLAATGRLEAAAARYERAAALGGGPHVYKALASLYGRLGRARDRVTALERYEEALLTALGGGGAVR